MNIKKELSKIEKLIFESDSIDTDFSVKSTYWHLDHSLRVIIGICKMLTKSNPDDYKWKFNSTRFVIFFKRKIPRGSGNAPKGVVNPEPISTDDLSILLVRARKELEEVEKLSKNHFFKHSVFGNLNVRKSQYLMALHSRHHIEIINDILYE